MVEGKVYRIMKNYVYFDSGTTNSRAYLIQNGCVSDSIAEKAGTVDNVLSGDKSTLEKALLHMYEKLLQANNLSDNEIDEIYMSGMATSKNGICEVDYARLPLGIMDYKKNVAYRNSDLFGRNIGYLTGVVSKPDKAGTIDNIYEFNNVRGEEIELFGIMEREAELFRGQNTAVIMPGSHTHVLFTKDQKIIQILSCMGGELFSAVSQHTILNASVSGFPEQGNETMRYAMKCGYDAVKKYGFNRATYMVRALDLFSDASQEERNFFYEGVIHADILTGIQSCREFQTLDRICIAGKPVYFDIFNTLINYEKWNIPCSYIEAKEESFALRGFLELIKLS